MKNFYLDMNYPISPPKGYDCVRWTALVLNNQCVFQQSTNRKDTSRSVTVTVTRDFF